MAWFADVCRRFATLLARVYVKLNGVIEEWRDRLSDVRSDSAAHRALPLLAGSGAVDTEMIARRPGVSLQSSRNAMSVLEAKGIVERATVPTGQAGRPPVAWLAPTIVEIITDASLRSRRL